MTNIREYQKYKKNKEQQRSDNGYFTKRLWFHRGRKLAFFLTVAGLIVAAAFGYRIYLNNKVYTAYDVVSIAELAENSDSTYLEYGNYILKYGMDGIVCLQKDNDKVWEISYRMKYPIVALCGEYGAVASRKGNDIYIFNHSGIQGSITVPHSITDISIASQGVVAVNMEEDGVNYVDIYERDGERKVATKTSLEGNGYPLDIALSPDGQKLVVAYLDIAEESLKSSVVFYNFSAVGENYIWNMVGAYDDYYEDTIIPYVTFINEETACAVGDDRVTVFSIKEIPDVRADIKLDKELKTCFYSKEYIGFAYDNIESGGSYEAEIYNLNGKKVLTYETERKYTSIQIVKDHVLFYNDNSCLLLTMTGKEKFSYTFDKKLKLIAPLSITRYTMVTESTMSEIHLK